MHVCTECLQSLVKYVQWLLSSHPVFFSFCHSRMYMLSNEALAAMPKDEHFLLVPFIQCYAVGCFSVAVIEGCCDSCGRFFILKLPRHCSDGNVCFGSKLGFLQTSLDLTF